MDGLDDYLERRRQEACRRLGASDPRCGVAGCSEADPLTLTGVVPTILCYEHQRVRDGLPIIEQHHVAGERNEPLFKVPLPGNDHRLLTVMSDGEGGNYRGALDELSRQVSREGGRRMMLLRSLEWDETTYSLLRDLDHYRNTPSGRRMWEAFCEWRNSNNRKRR